MIRVRNRIMLLGLLALLSVSCLQKTEFSSENLRENESNGMVLRWDEIAYEAFGGTEYQHSLMASRINAMTHLAMHDALNAIRPVYASYAFMGKDRGADANSAVAVAAHTVLVHEIPDKLTLLNEYLETSLHTIPESPAKRQGILLGKKAGLAVLGARANDGSAGDPLVSIAASSAAGVYQTVTPFDFIFAPYWQDVKPFALQRKDQFRSAPHPTLESDAYATAFNEVKETGRKNSTVRTADQTFYAHFWYEFSEAGWNRLTRVVAKKESLDMWETARLFALVDIAMADAYIAGWDAKFHYNLWRPYTAIRKAGDDGNGKTSAEANWESELPSPPVQDYPSTHSALGNAAATVLAHVLGDDVAFTMTSPTAQPAWSSRSFTSFSQAAYENADSRVQAGIHFRFACDAGLEMGKEIGDWVFEHALRPLKENDHAVVSIAEKDVCYGSSCTP